MGKVNIVSEIFSYSKLNYNVISLKKLKTMYFIDPSSPSFIIGITARRIFRKIWLWSSLNLFSYILSKLPIVRRVEVNIILK